MKRLVVLVCLWAICLAFLGGCKPSQIISDSTPTSQVVASASLQASSSPPPETPTLSLPVETSTNIEELFPTAPPPIPTLPFTTLIVPRNVSAVRELDSWGKGPIEDIGWSPTGSRLAVATALGIYIYHTRNYQDYIFIPTDSPVTAIDYRLNGDVLGAVTEAGRFYLLDGSQGSVQQIIQISPGLTSLAFHPEGKLVAIGSQDPKSGVQLWDLPGHRLLYIWRGSANNHSLAFSRSGGMLVGLEGDAVVIWDTTNGQKLATLRRPGAVYPSSLEFHPRDNLLLVGSDFGGDNSIDLYRVPRGGHQRILVGHKDAITDLAYHPNGNEFASSSLDGAIHFWNSSNFNRLRSLFPLAPEGPFIAYHLAYHPSGNRIAYAGRTSLVVWDIAQRLVVGSLQGHQAWDYTATLSPDGSQLAASPDGQRVELWDINRRQVLRSFADSPGPVSRLAFSPDGFFLAAGTDTSKVILWNLITGGRVFQAQLENAWGPVLPWFSPDGRLMAVANTSQLSLWDTLNGQKVNQVELGSPLISLAFSPKQDYLATALLDGSLQLRDPATLAVISTLGETTTLLWSEAQVLNWNALAFSPDGSRLSSAGEVHGLPGSGQFALWDLNTQARQDFQPTQEPITQIGYSPDGQIIATSNGAGGSLLLWDAVNGTLLQTLTGHTLPVKDLVFSPDGQLLVSISQDGSLRRWGIPQP